MMTERYIRIGFFDNLKGEDSILISADIYGLLELESVFLELTQKKKSIRLTQLKTVDKEYEIPITLISSDKDEGLKRVNEKYEWNLTAEKWSEFREKTTTLYRNGTNGHQYLDSANSDNSDLQVILSLNEYGIDFWKKIDRKNKNVW